MDSQLKELLEQIKQEGVQKAQTESDQIIQDAEEKARKIVADAEREAETLRQRAREDAEKTTQTGKDALAQASRDLLLSLEKEITRVFDAVVAKETGDAVSGESLADIIAAMVAAWVEKQSTDLTVLLPESQLEKLQTVLRSRLSATLKDGVELKPASNLDAGFRISTEGGAVYYDFSSQGIAEVLGAFVNPSLSQTIREAVDHQ